MNIIDRFTEFYFKNPGDIYERYIEFVQVNGLKLNFKEYVDCIDTVSKLLKTDEETLKKFKFYMEGKKI